MGDTVPLIPPTLLSKSTISSTKKTQEQENKVKNIKMGETVPLIPPTLLSKSTLSSTKKTQEQENKVKNIKMVETLCVTAAIHAAISGCSGVFQVASPCTVEDPWDPQEELLWAAVEGTCLLMQRSETFHKNGFIGSSLVRTLLEKGYTVRGTCQPSTPTTHLLSLLVTNLCLSLFEAD